MNSYERIVYEKKDHIATLTFNFPQKLNAMDRVMSCESHEVFAEVQADRSMRVPVLTGAGRGSCSGQGVRSFLEQRKPEFTAE